MELIIDRDGVCAGDDVETHEELRRYQPQMKVGAVVYSIVASGFLPEMSRGQAFWQAYANGTHAADIPGDGSQIHLRVDPDTELHTLCDPHHRPRLEFKYCTGAATTTPADGVSAWLIPGPRKYGTRPDDGESMASPRRDEG